MVEFINTFLSPLVYSRITYLFFRQQSVENIEKASFILKINIIKVVFFAFQTFIIVDPERVQPAYAAYSSKLQRYLAKHG